MLEGMSALFARVARRGLGGCLTAAIRGSDNITDFRSAVCRFEDDLFASFPAGHHLISYSEAVALLRDVFQSLGRRSPRLALVSGFADPRIGAFADIENHRVAIGQDDLYRFLVLHEAAHFVVPTDRRHGPAFTYILQLLYRSFLRIPEHAVRHFLKRHGLPHYTETRAATPAQLRDNGRSRYRCTR